MGCCSRSLRPFRCRIYLPTEYFHVVFTVPSVIAEIAAQNKAVVYGLLFRATAETLRTIAADPHHLGTEIGFFAVLHTWGQTLVHHPHLHCVIPGGGLASDGSGLGCLPTRILPAGPGALAPLPAGAPHGAAGRLRVGTAALRRRAGIAEVATDKGYHRNETMVGFAAIGVRSYVSEPNRGRRRWTGQAAARDAVYANRRRIRGARGKRLLRQRRELLERPNAHLYETGRMRRVHLRGHPNNLKRLLVQVCGVNLGLLIRHLTGVRAAEPPGPGRDASGRADRPPERLLGACAARLRSRAPRSAGFVVGWSGYTPIRTRDSRLTISPFCHGLLAHLRYTG